MAKEGDGEEMMPPEDGDEEGGGEGGMEEGRSDLGSMKVRKSRYGARAQLVSRRARVGVFM